MTVLIIGIVAAGWVGVALLVCALCMSAAQGEATLVDDVAEPAPGASLLDRTGHLATTRFSVSADGVDRQIPAA